MSQANATTSGKRRLSHEVTELGDQLRRPLSWTLIRRLLTYMQPYARLRNWLLVCVTLRAIQLPLLAWALGEAIGGPIRTGDKAGIVWAAVGFGVLALVTQAVFHFRSRLALMLGELVIQDIRQQLFTHLQRMTLGFFHRTRAGRLISRLTSDVEAMRVGVQDVLFISMVQLGQMLLAAAVMLYYSRSLFLIVLALLPVLWAINRSFRRRMGRAHQDLQESFSRITANLAESISGIRVTQGFARQDLNAEMFADLVGDHSRFAMGEARVSGVFLPLLEFNSQFFIALLLVVGGWEALQPVPLADVGDLVQFFFMATLFFSPIQNLGNLYSRAMSAMAGAERVFRLLDTPPDWQDPPHARPIANVRGQVEFRNVCFAYEADRDVLHNLSFEAQSGQTIALVGHTGCGKSTIIHLLAKFYRPRSGQVLIDSIPLDDIDSDSLRAHMAVVLQKNFLFTGTVADNIRIGRPGASDAQVAEAARRIDCLDLLEALPEGLATSIGEGGSGISLGQRQLICFARAMLADPRILLLDEATSSVDTMTEARIQASLERLLHGRTCFVVAHRLSTVRHADCVLVMDHGRLIEQGRHDDLLRAGGAYAELYRQFIRGQAE